MVNPSNPQYADMDTQLTHLYPLSRIEVSSTFAKSCPVPLDSFGFSSIRQDLCRLKRPSLRRVRSRELISSFGLDTFGSVFANKTVRTLKISEQEWQVFNMATGLHIFCTTYLHHSTWSYSGSHGSLSHLTSSQGGSSAASSRQNVLRQTGKRWQMALIPEILEWF